MGFDKRGERQLLRFSFARRDLKPSWLSLDAGHDLRIYGLVDLGKIRGEDVSKTKKMYRSADTCDKSASKQLSGIETPSAIQSPKDRAIGRKPLPKPECRPDWTVRQTMSSVLKTV